MSRKETARAHPDRFRTKSGLATIVVGTARELLVAADLMLRGFEIFKACSHTASCDLIALKNGRAIRVEVKSRKVPHRQRFDLQALVSENNEIEYFPGLEML